MEQKYSQFLSDLLYWVEDRINVLNGKADLSELEIIRNACKAQLKARHVNLLSIGA